jgi:uncharacterized membrane protein
MSGIFLFSVAVAIVLVIDQLLGLAVPLFLFAAFNLALSMKTRLSLGLSNVLALGGHLVASLVSYLLLTRIFWVTYRTDSMVATYLGVLKVLSFQNPYAYSIKPLLDQFAFPGSYYTPHLNGSFEFHLTYGALSFLSVLPMYAAGLHDLRDAVFIFHILSVLIVFGLVPVRQKALSLAPFVFFPVFVAASWTDAVWAFFLVLCPALWYRSRNMGLLMLAFAGASKQIALIGAPLLLIRLWRESPSSKLRKTLVGVGVLTGGFFGPSLPFILSSPSQWWTSTMVPYFPGAAAMVSGGLGLSEILLDMGASPPALYFMILMGIVGGYLLYFYSKRYWKSRCLVWVFPVFTILFYYRSFPNYVFYWGFPLALEYFKTQPTLSIWPFSPLKTTPRLFKVWGKLRSVTIQFKVGILASVMVTSMILGAYGAYVSTLPRSTADLRINSISDPYQVGAVTSMNITLDNVTPRSVRPLFFVKWGIWLSNLWISNSNHTLAASSSATYLVTATDGFAAVPGSENFRVYVYDAYTGNLIGASPSISANISQPTLANPLFELWTLDLEVGTRVPYDWKLATTNVDPGSPVIHTLDGSPGSGLGLQLNSTGSTTRPAKIMVSQETPLSSTRVNMSLDFQTANEGIRSELGVTVTDGTHELLYLFSNTVTRQVLSLSDIEETISVPVSVASWTSVSINANHDWLALGWPVPYHVRFTIFLQAESVGIYSASIRGLSSPE